MKPLIAAACAAAVLSAGAAQAQSRDANSAQDIADMQCMATFALIGASGDSDVQVMAGMALLYHLGRLEGRAPRVNWLQRFETWMRNLGDDKIMAEVAAHEQRCLDDFGRKSDELGRSGERMSNGA